MRGLRVALVEQNDFGSGTSSRSSRLVHGGVRYLEHGQLALVFESSRERRTLLRIAPHLVRPLSFVWPVYAAARVSRWKLAAALTLYDALALFRNVGRHERLSAADVLAREPRLERAELKGGARYWDAATDDARLTLANVRSAVAEGAVVVNHAQVEALLRDGERITGARVRATGHDSVLHVRARVIVNATGPWSDRVERMAHAAPTAAVRGSKGVHVSVPRDRVGNVSALTLIAPQDGRVMFVLPSGDFTIVGTTDTFDEVVPEEVRASRIDVAYLLDAANHFFPGAKLTEADVVSAWAGLRPLAAPAAGGSDPGKVSREHSIVESAPGLVRVTGGKLTTYRAMAAQIVDRVQRMLGGPGARSRSAIVPLTGGDVADVAGEVAEATRLVSDAPAAERLVRAHGSEWRAVWALAEAEPALRERVVAERPYLMATLRYAVEHELAVTLGDLLVRRTPIAFETRDHGRAAARAVAPVVAEWMGWGAGELERAVADYDAESAGIFTIEAGGS
jgi:glycerol-3-phosphate dehydrogenase